MQAYIININYFFWLKKNKEKSDERYESYVREINKYTYNNSFIVSYDWDINSRVVNLYT